MTARHEDVTPAKVRLWSRKHQMWWRPNARGYTTDVAEAGLYSPDEAAQHAATSTRCGDPDLFTVVLASAGAPCTGSPTQDGAAR